MHDPDTPRTIDGVDYPTQVEREAALSDLPHVSGHGIGHAEDGTGERRGELSVVVYVDAKVPLEDLDEDERIPETVGGVPTDAVEVGEMDLQMDAQRRAVLRPVAGGANIAGNSSGTVGATLWDTAADQPIISAAVHVVGNLTTDDSDLIGTDAYQPDYEHSDYHVGRVSKASNTAVESERTDICYVDPSESTDSDGLPKLSTHQFGLGETVAVEEPELDVRVMRSALNTGITSGRVVALDVTATISDVTFHGLFESDLFSQGGDSGSVVGHVTPEGDFAAMGSLIGGPTEGPGAFMSPLARAAQDSGLDPVEPLTGHADHTDHDLVSTDPPLIPSSIDPFLEAHPRHISHDGAGAFEIDVLFASTGGQTASSTFRIEESDGTTLVSDSITLDPNDYVVRTYSIDDSYDGTRLLAYTDDQAAELNADDLGIGSMGFVVADDASQTGYTETGPAPPSDLATPAIETDAVALSWDHSPDAGTPRLFEYHIYVDGEFDHAVSPTETSTSIGDLNADTDYRVGVVAVDRGGVASSPAEVSVTTAPEANANTAFVRASGTVTGSDDADPSTQSRAAARFRGDVVAIDAAGEGQLELDGEVLDPSAFPETPGNGQDPGETPSGDPEEIDRRTGSLWIRHDLRAAKQN